MMRNVTDDIIYVGADDHGLDLFESQYPIPDGVAYNSYVVKDEKIAIFDTIDQRKTDEWLENIKKALGNSTPDYVIVQHMEPDHSASLSAFLAQYPDTTVVGNKQTFGMIKQFFPDMALINTKTVANGESINLGKHELTFVFAPMVHWPEVMMTYDSYSKSLFSADGFGKFGALDVEQDWADEARRYYIGIVGKYGMQVQAVLKKAAKLDIQRICPLHGPVLDEDLGYYIDLYDKWSGYRPEEEGVCICYSSVYGNTRKAVKLLEEQLKGVGAGKVAVYDLARCDMSQAVSEAFRYDRLVLATTTYNGEIFPCMKAFIDHLTERNFQNRFVALIENGTWAPQAKRIMTEMLEKQKDIMYAQNNVTIRSAMDDVSREVVKQLAAELKDSHMDIRGEKKPAAPADAPEKKKWRCNICGYVYEGDSLPEDFVCPVCKRPASDFTLVEE